MIQMLFRRKSDIRCRISIVLGDVYGIFFGFRNVLKHVMGGFTRDLKFHLRTNLMYFNSFKFSLAVWTQFFTFSLLITNAAFFKLS